MLWLFSETSSMQRYLQYLGTHERKFCCSSLKNLSKHFKVSLLGHILKSSVRGKTFCHCYLQTHYHLSLYSNYFSGLIINVRYFKKIIHFAKIINMMNDLLSKGWSSRYEKVFMFMWRCFAKNMFHELNEAISGKMWHFFDFLFSILSSCTEKGRNEDIFVNFGRGSWIVKYKNW